MPQLVYADLMPEGFAGMLFDATPKVVSTYGNEDVTDTGLGLVVCQGTKANLAKKLVDINSTVLGFTIHDAAMDQSFSGLTGTNAYAPKAPMNVLTHGRCWARCETAMAVGANVFVRHTAAAGGSVIGILRNALDGVTASTIQLKGARVIRAGGVAGICGIAWDLAVNRGFTY